MLTGYIVACILVAIGAVLFGIGWKGGKSESHEVCPWLFFGVVFGIIGWLVAMIQWIMA